jgi:hypothetical protein
MECLADCAAHLGRFFGGYDIWGVVDSRARLFFRVGSPAGGRATPMLLFEWMLCCWTEWQRGLREVLKAAPPLSQATQKMPQACAPGGWQPNQPPFMLLLSRPPAPNLASHPPRLAPPHFKSPW